MKTKVIYHSADFDGLFCREIARKFMPDAELVGWNFGDEKIPFPETGVVYVLDLSPDCFEMILASDSQLENLIWIDHHKSAIEKYSPDIPGYRIDGVAACRLAWQWFTAHLEQLASFDLPTKEQYVNREVNEPLAVRLAGEYDIWDKRDPRAELFQLGLKAVFLTDGVWEELLEPKNLDLIPSILDRGELIQYYREQEYQDVITSQGFTVEFEGLKFLACNSHECDIRSQLFTAGILPEHDGLLGFTYTGSKWRISMYGVPSKPELDFSVIAKKHGGGGHKQACGFICKELPFKL